MDQITFGSFKSILGLYKMYWLHFAWLFCYLSKRFLKNTHLKVEKLNLHE